MTRNAGSAVALCFVATLSSGILRSPAVVAQPYHHQGYRFIGLAPGTCRAPAKWQAKPLFAPPNVPPGGGELCQYVWAGPGAPPQAAIDSLVLLSGAARLDEEVPVLLAMSPAPWTGAELGFFHGLRSKLLQHVGTAALLPSWPVVPVVPVARIAVLDSAPDAPHGAIEMGAGSRHGDTLAHLIEDLVCAPPVAGVPRACAAQVTTELALPWTSAGLRSAAGGHTGTLGDLAQAIHRAVVRWESDRASAPQTTPHRLILNLSVGWEHTAGIADCPVSPETQTLGLPARAVQAALQYAASRGALIIASAGNDSGGQHPRAGLTCPGNYHSLPQQGAPSQRLLVAVSGVDYGDRPLENSRPSGHTPLVALGLGAVAWKSGVDAPPALVGSSVAAAVTSAVAALVWAYRPTWSASQVTAAVYDGGRLVGSTADACPDLSQGCETRRANVCGALKAAGASLRCGVPAPLGWSSPSLPAELAALTAAFAVAPSSCELASSSLNPRYLQTAPQISPWTFPMPISATCPTCVVSSSSDVSSSSGATTSELWLPDLGRGLLDPMLLLRLDDDSLVAVQLGLELVAGTSYRFPLPLAAPIRAAYLAGLDAERANSITEQVFVHR
jgi:Subtilase family